MKLPSISLVLCLLLAACVPAPTATPVAVAPAATPTVAPSGTPTLARTPLPTATVTSMPTVPPTSIPTDTPTATPTTEPTQIKLQYYGKIRQGPGDNYPIIRLANQGTTYDACGRVGSWIQICGHTDPQWWIDGSSGIEFVQESIENLPTKKAPPTATPTATSSQPRVEVVVSSNIRGGPGTNYPVVGKGSPGEQFHVCGRNESGDWVQLCGYTNPQRWIYTEADLGLVQFKTGTTGQLPVVLAPPTPIPTPVFVTIGSPFPPEWGIPLIWSNDSFNGPFRADAHDDRHGHCDIAVPLGYSVHDGFDIDSHSGDVRAPVAGKVSVYHSGLTITFPKNTYPAGILEALGFAEITNPSLDKVSRVAFDIGHVKDIATGWAEKGDVIAEIDPFSPHRGQTLIGWQVFVWYSGVEYELSPTLFELDHSWDCFPDSPYDCIPEPGDYAP